MLERDALQTHILLRSSSKNILPLLLLASGVDTRPFFPRPKNMVVPTRSGKKRKYILSDEVDRKFFAVARIEVERQCDQRVFNVNAQEFS